MTGAAATAAAAAVAAAAAMEVAATVAYGAAEVVLGAATSGSLTPPSDGGFGAAQAAAVVQSAAVTGVGVPLGTAPEAARGAAAGTCAASAPEHQLHWGVTGGGAAVAARFLLGCGFGHLNTG